MEKWKKRSINLLFSLIFGGGEDFSVVPYYPQKTMVGLFDEPFFRRGIPERHGISSKRLYNMLCRLEAERRANVHSLLVIADGEVICECSAEGYSVGCWQVSHSMSKTVCGMVIGLLIGDGLLSLDTKLVDIFPEIAYRDKKFPQITIHHLLSMTAGVDFAEAGAVTEKDWTSAYFSSTVRFNPGTKFAYNSMNTYILARIAERVSAKPFGKVADEKIFAPMGIQNYLWELGPEGCEKAGWGLYMSPESWGKLGYMMLCRGDFFGKRILPESWVELSSTVKAVAPEYSGGFNYAYQMWTSRTGEEILFSGMLGQNVWICPKNKVVVVMTGGNNELFQASPALEIVRSHLGGKIEDGVNKRDLSVLREKERKFLKNRRWASTKEKNRGLFALWGKRISRFLDGELKRTCGRYAFVENNVSVIPLILRAMQNNFYSGIDILEVEMAGDNLLLIVREGREEYIVLAGLYRYTANVISVRNEKYRVMATACVENNGRGERELRLELIFSETASVRRIVIERIGDEMIRMRLSETPNNRLLERFLDEYSSQNSTIAFAKGVIERRFGERVISEKAERTFTPIITGVRTTIPGYRKLLDEMAAPEESGSIKFIRALLERFFKEDDKKKSSSMDNKKSAKRLKR